MLVPWGLGFNLFDRQSWPFSGNKCQGHGQNDKNRFFRGLLAKYSIKPG